MSEHRQTHGEFEAMTSNQESEVSTETEDSEEEESSWITWFLNLKGNEFLCSIDEDFIRDDFNLTGLSSSVPFYDQALDLILDAGLPQDSLTEEQQEVIDTAAEVLYGLIHARFILTGRGMQKMNEKLQSADFGRCPRVYCQGQPCLPVCLSDVARNYPVNIYCPRCCDIYLPKSRRHENLDGAYFGTTFAHLFLLLHPELVPARASESYVPRIYGFRIHPSSPYHPSPSSSLTQQPSPSQG